jgi:hypothetical protein
MNGKGNLKFSIHSQFLRFRLNPNRHPLNPQTFAASAAILTVSSNRSIAHILNVSRIKYVILISLRPSQSRGKSLNALSLAPETGQLAFRDPSSIANSFNVSHVLQI